MEDAMLHTDSINPQVIKAYAKQRIKYYENEFSKISNLTILDPDQADDSLLAEIVTQKFANHMPLPFYVRENCLGSVP